MTNIIGNDNFGIQTPIMLFPFVMINIMNSGNFCTLHSCILLKINFYLCINHSVVLEHFKSAKYQKVRIPEWFWEQKDFTFLLLPLHSCFKITFIITSNITQPFVLSLANTLLGQSHCHVEKQYRRRWCQKNQWPMVLMQALKMAIMTTCGEQVKISMRRSVLNMFKNYYYYFWFCFKCPSVSSLTTATPFYLCSNDSYPSLTFMFSTSIFISGFWDICCSICYFCYKSICTCRD